MDVFIGAYVERINAGLMTLDQVPEPLRTQVEDALQKQ